MQQREHQQQVVVVMVVMVMVVIVNASTRKCVKLPSTTSQRHYPAPELYVKCV